MMLTISPRLVARGLTVLLAALLLANAGAQYSRHVLGHDDLLGFVRQFDHDHEGNVPTWFEAALLLCSGGLLAAIARARLAPRAPYARH